MVLSEVTIFLADVLFLCIIIFFVVVFITIDKHLTFDDSIPVLVVPYAATNRVI